MKMVHKLLLKGRCSKKTRSINRRNCNIQLEIIAKLAIFMLTLIMTILCVDGYRKDKAEKDNDAKYDFETFFSFIAILYYCY